MPKTTRWGRVLGTLLAAAPFAAHAQAEKLERAIEAQIEVDREARASQQRVDLLDDETQKLLNEYRRALGEQNVIVHVAGARVCAAQSPSANTHTAPPSGTSGNSPGRIALRRFCIPRASMPHPDCTAMY